MARTALLVVAVTLTAACRTSPAAPSPAPVRVTVTQNPTFTGDSLVFGMRVENISQAAVDLTFPSSCDVLPYFRDQRTGQLVTPAGGGFACLTVIGQRTLQPGDVLDRSVLVKAGTAPLGQFVVLPPGGYTIEGRLEDQVFRVQSERVAFTLP